MTAPNPWGLTPREAEVCKLLSANRGTNAAIAGKLGVSRHTIDHHLKVIFSKMGVSNRRQASKDYLAWERGIGAAPPPAPPPATPWDLTPAEINICEAIVTGHVEDKILIRVFGISTRTVTQHLANVYQKMGVRNRVMAALTYDRWARVKEAA